MVIGNLDGKGIAVFPTETYAPLVVDADAPLASAVAGKLLKAIAAGRNTEKVEGGGAMKLFQLALRNALHVLRQFCRKAAREELLCLLAGKERIIG
jgi:hypothetical protein